MLTEFERQEKDDLKKDIRQLEADIREEKEELQRMSDRLKASMHRYAVLTQRED